MNSEISIKMSGQNNKTFLFFYLKLVPDIIRYTLSNFFDKEQLFHLMIKLGINDWKDTTKLLIYRKEYSIVESIFLEQPNIPTKVFNQVKEYIFENCRTKISIRKLLFMNLFGNNLSFVCKYKNTSALIQIRSNKNLCQRLKKEIYGQDNPEYIQFLKNSQFPKYLSEPFLAPKCYQWEIQNDYYKNMELNQWIERLRKASFKQLERYIVIVGKSFPRYLFESSDINKLEWAYNKNLLPPNPIIKFKISSMNILRRLIKMKCQFRCNLLLELSRGNISILKDIVDSYPALLTSDRVKHIHLENRKLFFQMIIRDIIGKGKFTFRYVSKTNMSNISVRAFSTYLDKKHKCHAFNNNQCNKKNTHSIFCEEHFKLICF